MRRLWAVTLGAMAFLAVAETASAIPAFARRYGVACHFCHDGYPKLNSNGQRFKERGFRMAQEDPFDVEAWAKTVPLAVRPQGRHTFIEDQDGFNYFFVKGISAGNLGSRVSYWIDDGLFYDDVSEDWTHTKIDNGYGRVELVKSGKLYLKGGRFELDLPFTQTRTPNLFPYDIYSTNTGLEEDSIGMYQQGVEVGGSVAGPDVHWSVAVVQGRNDESMEDLSDDVGKFDANVFLRVAKRIQQHRIGLFSYIGRSTLATSPTIVWEDKLLRVGADADLHFDKFNLYGVFMYGRNDNPVATPDQPNGTGEALDFTGGFAQAEYNVIDNLQLTVRFNAVNRPPSASSSNETFTSVFPGIRFFIRERFRIGFEYGFQNQDQGDLGAVQAELVF